jgi:type IV secretion system protein VirB1
VSANALRDDTPVEVVPAIPVVMDRSQTGGSIRIKPGVTHRAGASRDATAPDTNQTHPSWDAFGDYPCDGPSCR